jgi:pimeloyl-ACP methyl ester carboxylesterase
MKLLAAAVSLAVLACGSGASPTQPHALPRFFENGGIRLAFTLDLPPGKGPFPAVVMGHGSGRVTRDQLAWAAMQLTRLGFAVLRFDKRGVGESTGEFVFVGTNDSPTVFPQLASDVAAGVRFLRTRDEIDGRRIGLFGVSQAGWILPIAARDLGDVAFMVLWSGPVCTVGQEMFYSEIVENTGRPVADGNSAMARFTGPDGFDPLPVLRSVTAPTLWLLGLDDHSIPVRVTLDNLEALAAAGRPFQWKTYDGLGHSLSPSVWDDIGRWLARWHQPSSR